MKRFLLIATLLLTIAPGYSFAEVSCYDKSQIFKYLSMWKHSGSTLASSIAGLESSYKKIPKSDRDQYAEEVYSNPKISALTDEEVEQQTDAICRGNQSDYLPPDPKIAEEHKRGRYCYMKGHLYMQSALQRDAGGSPQKSFEWFTSDRNWDVVPRAEIKKAINQIYFDPAFAYAGGDALFNQVTDICMNGPKKWRPLK